MRLEPLPYHREVATQLERQEPKLWSWFSSEQLDAAARQRQQLEIMKNAIELPSTGANLRRHELAAVACSKLELAAPVRLYQSHDVADTPNAMLLFDPEAIQIMFCGRILELLSEAELLDLLGHEISHYKLYHEDGGRYLAANRLLNWSSSRPGCPFPFLETARRFSLYSEIYCDLGGLVACGDRMVTISSLAKSIADFKDVDAVAYLAQAEKILALDASASAGSTHPELHIRVLALAHRERLPADAYHALLRRLVDGPLDLQALDLLAQAQLRSFTRLIIDRVAAMAGQASEPLLAQARDFFPDFEPSATPPDVTAIASIASDESTRLYLAYVLLDLVLCDPDGMERIWPAVAETARTAGLEPTLAKVAREELKGRRKLLKMMSGK